mgnify:CR=1 FL=1|tara:strand:- start:1282 stop:1578 length:297 start_codon:yes stop_codon:yes gene_type:complete
MIKEFNARRVVRFFIYLLSALLIFKLFYGKSSFFVLTSNNETILKIKNSYKNLLKERDNLDFLLKQYNDEKNLDFKEVIIRKELNYKSDNESIYIIDD